MRRAMLFLAVAAVFSSLAVRHAYANEPAGKPALSVNIVKPTRQPQTMAAAILAARKAGVANEQVSDRVFQIACVVIERQADGSDQTISRPQVLTLGGQPAHVQIAQATPLVTGLATTDSGAEKPVISVVTTGTTLAIKVVPEKAGRAAFDVSIERSAIEAVEETKLADGTTRQSARIGSKTTRILESIELGKQLVVGLEDKDATKSKTRVEFVVTEVQAPRGG